MFEVGDCYIPTTAFQTSHTLPGNVMPIVLLQMCSKGYGSNKLVFPVLL